MSGIDSSMLTWITTRSMSVPWLKISLRSSLSRTGLVPSGIRSSPLRRGEELVGEHIAVDHDADGVLHLLLLVDDVFALAADVGRVEQAAVDEDHHDGPDRQAPRRQHGDGDEITRE